VVILNRKPRILFVGEASFLATGFATYWNEVIKRLYDTNKFDIAEIGAYAHADDSRNQGVLWKFYPAAPPRNNQKAMQIYNSKPTYQFGEMIFDDVCLEYKPDYVLAIRDWWMDEFILRSPYRKYFTYLWLLTIDGIPQRDLWLESYKQCDGCLTYSQWGMDVMKKTGLPETDMITVASPGADLDVFKPVPDKKAHKAKMGIDPNAIIIGTVMRNQQRKLYYDLIEAFSIWIQKAKSEGKQDLINKTFLYLHTSYPDQGYDIAKAIKEFKIGNRVVMTYMCPKCQIAYPSFFAGELTHCRKCKELCAHTPNAGSSCSREMLAAIMNCFDLYVQYSVCLGKDEEISTKNGWKKISEIEIGEEVFTHKHRYKKVLDKFITPNEGNIREISIHSDYEKLVITDNHPCYAITKDMLSQKNRQTTREQLGNRIRNNINIPDPSWIEVKNLKANDCLVYCIDDSVIDIEKIDLKEFAKENDVVLDNYIEIHKGDIYPRYININEEFCEFLGLFVADGHSNISKSKQIQITYADHEQYNENLCSSIWNKLSDKQTTISTYYDRKARDSKMCSRIHNEIFDQWCSRKENKKLPDWALSLPNNKTRAILKGLFIGDGYYNGNRYGLKTSIYVTISKTLADQIKHLLRRNRINFNVHIDYRLKSKDKKNRKPQYRFEVPGNISEHEFIDQRSSTHNLYYKNYHIIKIKEIKDSNYSEDIYNIEVEDDNSYKTKISVLHNCEGFGMPLLDAQACGIPTMAVRYSAMEDHLRCPTSIPIEVGRFFYEGVTQTEQKRALPDNRDFVNKLHNFLKLSDEKRKELSIKTRQYIEELSPVYGQKEMLPRGGWERTAKIWENVIDEIKLKDISMTWTNPEPRLNNLNIPSIPNNLNNHEFVKWIIKNMWKRPDMTNTKFAEGWIRSLNTGFHMDGHNKVTFDRNSLVNYFINMMKHENMMEMKRINSLKEINKNSLSMVEV